MPRAPRQPALQAATRGSLTPFVWGSATGEPIQAGGASSGRWAQSVDDEGEDTSGSAGVAVLVHDVEEALEQCDEVGGGDVRADRPGVLSSLEQDRERVVQLVASEVSRLAAPSAVRGSTWVVDGNYVERVSDTLWPRADTIVWLDLPLWVVLPRIVRRTVGRIRRRTVLWGGNRERWTALVGRGSLLVWAVQQHRRTSVLGAGAAASGSGGCDGCGYLGEEGGDVFGPVGAEDEVTGRVDPQQVSPPVAAGAAPRRGCGGPGDAVVVEPPQVAVLGFDRAGREGPFDSVGADQLAVGAVAVVEVELADEGEVGGRDEQPPAPVSSAAGHWNPRTVDGDERVGVAVPGPRGGGAERLHHCLAQHVVEGAAEQDGECR